MLPNVELIPRLRLLFYILCYAVQDYYYQDFDSNNNNNIIDDIDIDQTGLVAINLVSSFAPSTTRNLKDLIMEAFPIRVITIQTIFYHTKSNMFSLEQYIIPSYFSINIPLLNFTNLIIHYCKSELEAAVKLRQRGVPFESIPNILGGFWSYDTFDEWFEKTYQQYSINVLNNVNNNDTKIPLPDIVEEKVAVSDIVHLFHSGISDDDYVEDLSQPNSNYSNDDDDDIDELVNLDEYFDYENDEIISEESDTFLPLVNSLNEVTIKSTAAIPETDRSMHNAKHVDSTCELLRCNDDRVVSESVSTTNPNHNRIYPNNWTDRWSEKMIELCTYRE